MIGIEEIARAYDIDSVNDVYQGNVEITDLRDELGTKGHVLVVRGDKAYADRLGENSSVATPKFWLYENLIASDRVQRQLEDNPEHKLFDGVGFSSLEALGYHAKRIRRKAIAVMAAEFMPQRGMNLFGVKVLRANPRKHGRMEQGYVAKQEEVLKTRRDLIPLHQALYGAQALAPIGNKVTQMLEDMCIPPDETYWSAASGSNLYGIGTKVKNTFGSRIILVEPTRNITISPDLNVSDKGAVKDFAKRELKDYSLEDWNGSYSGIHPLHVAHANRYMLLNWFRTGDTGFDRTINISESEVAAAQSALKRINPEYDWTETTALALAPAIKSAEEGKNVLVTSYGKNRGLTLRDLNTPWIFRGQTAAQKATLGLLTSSWMAGGIYYWLGSDPNAPSIFPVP